MFPQSQKTARHLRPIERLRELEQHFGEGFHVSYVSKSHAPYPSSEPPGGKRPFKTNDYRRWCVICQAPRDTKGGHIRGGKFTCGQHP